MKNQFTITKDLYFEDIVIGYSRFRKDFDGIKAKFEGFIRAVKAEWKKRVKNTLIIHQRI